MRPVAGGAGATPQGMWASSCAAEGSGRRVVKAALLRPSSCNRDEKRKQRESVSIIVPLISAVVPLRRRQGQGRASWCGADNASAAAFFTKTVKNLHIGRLRGPQTVHRWHVLLDCGWWGGGRLGRREDRAQSQCLLLHICKQGWERLHRAWGATSLHGSGYPQQRFVQSQDKHCDFTHLRQAAQGGQSP